MVSHSGSRVRGGCRSSMRRFEGSCETLMRLTGTEFTKRTDCWSKPVFSVFRVLSGFSGSVILGVAAGHDVSGRIVVVETFSSG